MGDKEEALAKSFVNQFYKLKWNDLFGCHDPENFIRNYIKELPIEYYAKFIKYYMNEFIDKYKSIFLLQSDLLKTEEFILDPDIFTDHAIVLTQKEIFPDIDYIEKVCPSIVNPDIMVLCQHIELLRKNVL